MNSDQRELQKKPKIYVTLRFPYILQEAQSIAKKMRIKEILSHIDPDIHSETEVSNIIKTLYEKKKIKI